MPRQVRRRQILLGPLKGRSIVTSWYDYPGALLGYTERALLGWLQRNVRQGETWIDVGAHYGYTALALSELVGPQGRVFAFEPILTTAGYLDRTRELNDLPQLRVVPLALAACYQMRSLRVPAVRGMADHLSAEMTSRMDSILAIAFDEVWPGMAEQDIRIHGLKIDVQGMEIEALTGMRKHLLSSRPVLVIEVHRGVDRQALRRLLDSLGYDGRGEAIDPARGGVDNDYADNCSYCFVPMT